MKSIKQLENEIKALREKFSNDRTQFKMRRSVSFKDELKEQEKEMSEMQRRNDLERQKELLKDLIALGVVDG